MAVSGLVGFYQTITKIVKVVGTCAVVPMALIVWLAFPAQASKYAAVLMDGNTGKTLHTEHADEKRYPASLTKMMTLYLTFDALNSGKLSLNKKLKVSRRSAAQAPSKIGLRPGETIRVKDAILALTTKSANDVAVVLAEAISGSEPAFAKKMNQKARKLGMKNTRFQNASGLPNFKQTTTARDMATLSRALIRNHQKYYSYFSQQKFIYKGVTYRNHNRLLGRYPGIDGLKTGYIDASGFNLAASAVRQGKRLICVVFGGPSSAWRDRRVVDLLNVGFGVKKGRTLMMAAHEKPVSPLPDAPPLPIPKPDVAESEFLSPPPSFSEPEDTFLFASFLPTGGTDAPEGEEMEMAESAFVTSFPPGIEGTLTFQDRQIGDGIGSIQEAPPQQQQIVSLDIKPVEKAEVVTSRPPGWSIQVGAYSSRKAGQQAIVQVIRLLPRLQEQAKPTVFSTPASGTTIYRARLTDLSEQDAKSACQHLKSQGHPCMTISPARAGS